MDVKLYMCTDVPNKLNKNPVALRTITDVALPEGTDDYELTLRMGVDTLDLDWDLINYLGFNKAFYFVDSVEMVRNRYSLVHCTMDLLMSYRSQIGGLKVRLVRSTSAGSPRASDPNRLSSADAQRSVQLFPNPIPDDEASGLYILATAQSGYQQV